MNRLSIFKNSWQHKLVSTLVLLTFSIQQPICCTEEKGLIFQLVDKKYQGIIYQEGERVFRGSGKGSTPDIDEKISDLSPITDIFEWQKNIQKLYYKVTASEYKRYSEIVKGNENLTSILQSHYKNDPQKVLNDLKQVFTQVIKEDKKRIKHQWDIQFGDIDDILINVDCLEPHSGPYSNEVMKKRLDMKNPYKENYIHIILHAIKLEEDASIDIDNVSIESVDGDKSEAEALDTIVKALQELDKKVDNSIEETNKTTQQKNKNQIRELRNENSQLKIEVKNLGDQLRSTQNDATNSNKLQKEKENLEKEVLQLKNQINQLSTKISQLQNTTRNNDIIQKEKENLEQEVLQLKNELNQLKNNQKSTTDNEPNQKEEQDLASEVQKLKTEQKTRKRNEIIAGALFLGLLIISHLLLSGEALRKLFNKRTAENRSKV